MDGTAIIAYTCSMIGFLIKKNFYDLWDNLFRVALLNIGFIASAAIVIFIPPLLESIPVLSIGVMVIGIIWCFLYLAAAAQTLTTISDYGAFGFADFFNNFKTTWPAGLLMGVLVVLAGVLIMVVLPFYLELGSILGLFLAAIIFWGLVVAILSLQFFLTVRSRLDKKLFKALKKCFIIFFDNPGFCIFMFITDVLLLVISVFLAFMFPGPAGILLYLDQGLRLRLLKYDWLEENPGENRKKIPWDSLLIDDRERTGDRTFKNFIFPWKD